MRSSNVKWTNQEICDYYDSNPNLILADFARQLGITVKELKDILMGE
jgi:hypothetical protein